MKKNLALLLFIILSSTLSAIDWSKKSIEGFWGQSISSDPSYGETYIAIKKVSASGYFIISYSTRDPKHLTFCAKGEYDKEGALIIQTDKKIKWMITRPMAVKETISISDISGEFEVALLSRIE